MSLNFSNARHSGQVFPALLSFHRSSVVHLFPQLVHCYQHHIINNGIVLLPDSNAVVDFF